MVTAILITLGVIWLLTVVFDLPYIAMVASGAASAAAVYHAVLLGGTLWPIIATLIVVLTVFTLFTT